MYKLLRKQVIDEIASLELAQWILDTVVPELISVVEKNSIVTSHGEIVFVMPYNLDDLKKNTELLLSEGWMVDGAGWTNINDGVLIKSFKFPVGEKLFAHLSIQLRPDYAGSTCKIVKISTETKDIVEVVCMENVNAQRT